VSYSGDLFEPHDLLLAPLRSAIQSPKRNYGFLGARLPSDAGAAVHAAKLSGIPLASASIATLEAHFRPDK